MTNMTCMQRSEVEKLISFFRRMGYTRSSQVSRYIREHKLGYEYPHIAGYLSMSDGAHSWVFEGGIAPEFYRIICSALELSNNGSHAYVEDFESYASRHEQRRSYGRRF